MEAFGLYILMQGALCFAPMVTFVASSIVKDTRSTVLLLCLIAAFAIGIIEFATLALMIISFSGSQGVGLVAELLAYGPPSFALVFSALTIWRCVTKRSRSTKVASN
jgi:hypothetical protein